MIIRYLNCSRRHFEPIGSLGSKFRLVEFSTLAQTINWHPLQLSSQFFFFLLPPSLHPRASTASIKHHLHALPRSTVELFNMRFQLTLIFSALNVSSTFARMNHASTRTHDHPSIARRQHQHQPLLLGDTCVQVKASVLINSMVEVVDSLNLLDTNTGLDLFAKADVCLCLSAVSLFVQTDIRLRAMVDLVGEDKTELMLRTLVGPIVCPVRTLLIKPVA